MRKYAKRRGLLLHVEVLFTVKARLSSSRVWKHKADLGVPSFFPSHSIPARGRSITGSLFVRYSHCHIGNKNTKPYMFLTQELTAFAGGAFAGLTFRSLTLFAVRTLTLFAVRSVAGLAGRC